MEPSGAPLEPSIFLYLCQINSDLYETWNLSFWGPNWLIPLILAIPSVLSAPSGTLWSPSRALYILISLTNQLGSLWNLNLKLLGSQLVDPSYPEHPLCSTSTLWNPLEPSGSLFIAITQPNQLRSLWILKLKLLGSQLVDPTYPGHPLCSISALWSVEPSGAPLEPSLASAYLYLCQFNSDLY